ncbi:MAG: rhomboid family intramembrane serine protease [Candidatus Neptunochlamydia sp.]|nr:rhomboid family intramembrane serine protease [Candidatus Neptunochlamydia sp.]
MMYQSQAFKLGPTSTPKIVKWTIFVTLVVSFFSLVSNALFTQVFHIPSPQYLFSLTTWGVHKFFIWQFLSYLFLQPISSSGISMTLILHVFFDIYLLWAIGSAIVQARGEKHFIGLYFGGALLVGIIAYLSLLFFDSPLPFAGGTTSIYILLIGWTFLFPEAMIMLFLLIPVRAKWLVFGLIGVKLFLDFSNGNFLSFFVTSGAMLYGYLYSVLVWDSLSPFRRLHSIEKKLIYLKRKWFYRFRKVVDIEVQLSKVYNFKTGKAIIQDDDFMDACLDKISKKGKNSLTICERFRMWRISRKKNSLN